jgi:hypothetical protein
MRRGKMRREVKVAKQKDEKKFLINIPSLQRPKKLLLFSTSVQQKIGAATFCRVTFSRAAFGGHFSAE